MDREVSGHVRLSVLVLLLLLPLPSWGQPDETDVNLVPDRSVVSFRAYGLGLLPLDGRFTRFNGILRYHLSAGGSCTVSLHVAVGSLMMTSDTTRAEIVGPDFLDAARFPSLVYDGACEGSALTGRLTMHGVTRSFALDMNWKKDGVTASGRLYRADWGMTARPLLGGSTVRITVSVPLAVRP